jgi:hypothetical protein
MSLTGRQALLQYSVAGPPLWHERLVCDHIAADDYVIITPDKDVYVETLSILNPDLSGLSLRLVAGGLPVGILPGQVYALGAWTAMERAALVSHAASEATAERLARGVVVAAAAAVGAVVPVAGGAPPAVGPAPTLKWYACCSGGGAAYGSVVAGVLTPAVDGGRALHSMPDGTVLFVECVDDANLTLFQQRPASWDMRLLPQVLSGLGVPERTLGSAVASSREEVVLWKLPGPRTAKWCLNFLVIEGLGFEGHHERVRTLCKLDPSSWGVQEHYQLTQVIRQAIMVDQLDGFNCMMVEVLFRRLQTIEFAHSERLRDSESKASGGRLSIEEQSAFGGLTRQAGTLMICPTLMDHVKIEVERDASLHKNLRKAREEREAIRKAGKGGGKGHKEAEP